MSISEFINNLKNKLSSSVSQKASQLFLTFLVLLAIPFSVFTIVNQNLEIRKLASSPTPTQSPDNLVQKPEDIHLVEPPDRGFTRHEIGDKIVYFHQRRIGEAIVEKDYINYQFEKQNETFLKKTENWQPNLPEQLPSLKLTQDQAMAMVEGDPQFANLYFISPESDVFPFDPFPQNPCWIVNSLDERGFAMLTIIDAVTGKNIGRGIPPPSKGFALTGAQDDLPCFESWDEWSLNAQTWFERWGYDTHHIIWPTKKQIEVYIRRPTTTLFYEIAHGSSDTFEHGCYEYEPNPNTFSWDILKWLTYRNKLSFSFIGSCEGMCEAGFPFFSYTTRKGSLEDTTVVGYCHMGHSKCSDCWINSLSWQNNLFNYISQGSSVKTAFDNALADYPTCQYGPGPEDTCMRFVGDEIYKIPLLSTPTSTPTPSHTPTPTPSLFPGPGILWVTPYVSLQADDFLLISNGNTFVDNTPSLDLEGAPSSLWAGWWENDQAVAIDIYFEKDESNWWASQIHTYHLQEDVHLWYYGPFFTTPLDTAFTGDVDLVSQAGQPFSGSLHFENLRLLPFQSPTPTSTPTPRPTPTNQPPNIGTLTPAFGGSRRVGQWAQLKTTYLDPDGSGDIQWAFFFLDRIPPIDTGGLVAAYNQTNNIFWLKDGGTCQPGAADLFLSNDYLTLSCPNSTVSREGEILTIDWVFRPQKCFDDECGVNIAIEYVNDQEGLSGIGVVGSWTLNPATGAAPQGPTNQPSQEDLDQLLGEIETWQSEAE